MSILFAHLYERHMVTRSRARASYELDSRKVRGNFTTENCAALQTEAGPTEYPSRPRATTVIKYKYRYNVFPVKTSARIIDRKKHGERL